MSFLRKLKQRIIYILVAGLYAYGYFYLTAYFFFEVAEGNLLMATILNMSIIMLIVSIDKAEDYFLRKMLLKHEEKKNIFIKLLKGYANSVSVKSALYFFYVGILICSALVSAQPDLPYLSYFKDYFQTVDYGILLLIAADQFLGQLFKDIAKK